MSGAPAVTVVIPTYNRRDRLPRAIASVLAQEGVETELIVVDDASPDGTADWVAAERPQARLIRAPANRGVSATRNAGLAAARGRFIAFLDDDDWWDPAFLRSHLELLDSRPDAVLSYCDFTSVAEGGSAPVRRDSGETGPDPVRTFLLENPIRSLSLAVARREALQAAGGFREDYGMCEDREFYLRLLSRGAFARLPRPLAFKVRSADSVTLDLARWAHWAQVLLDDFYAREQSRPYRGLEGLARARWDARIAIKCLRRAGERRLGLGLAARALRRDALGVARYLYGRVARRE